MGALREDLDRRLMEYVQRHGGQQVRPLGWGVHGTVFLTKFYAAVNIYYSAVKVHEHESAYQTERDVYLRLKQHQVSEIRGCNVPEILNWDDELWVIEMGVVERPYVLDFAGAYLDRRPDYTDEVLAEWRAEKQEQFGADWGEVELILAHLERYGVFVSDVTPANIAVRPAE
jgi:hypothetical protein